MVARAGSSDPADARDRFGFGGRVRAGAVDLQSVLRRLQCLGVDTKLNLSFGFGPRRAYGKNRLS